MAYISGDQGLLNRLNKSRILNVLRIEGPISRIKLTRKTGLDAKTITNISAGLLKRGIIKSAGFESSSGGRKPELLKLNENYGVTIGIDLGATHLSGVVIDFGGNILSREQMAIAYGDGKKRILNKAVSLISRLLEFSRNKNRNILGIGFVVPGLVDIKKGFCIYAANITGWQNIPLGQIIKKKFHLEVEIEDSSRAMALGEKWFGEGRKMDDFIFLDLGAGIGCGIINNGRLYRGFSHAAGEIGHTIVEVDGRKCRCGNIGCLETVASGMSMPELAREKIKAGKKSSILDLVDGDLQKITAEIITEAAGSGDRLAGRILTRAGRYLGVAIANTINLLNPRAIIIGGGLSRAGRLLLEPMKESISRHTVPNSLKEVRILYSRLGNDVAPLGAATLILRKIFEF